MLLSCSVRRIADSLPKGIQRADRQDVVDPFFQKLQALLRREGKCPADEGQIYAVFAVLRKGGGIAGVEIGIGHSASIALMMKRRQPSGPPDDTQIEGFHRPLDTRVIVRIMVSIKEATDKAIAFARSALGPERTTGLRLEEVES